MFRRLHFNESKDERECECALESLHTAPKNMCINVKSSPRGETILRKSFKLARAALEFQVLFLLASFFPSFAIMHSFSTILRRSFKVIIKNSPQTGSSYCCSMAIGIWQKGMEKNRAFFANGQKYSNSLQKNVRWWEECWLSVMDDDGNKNKIVIVIKRNFYSLKPMIFQLKKFTTIFFLQHHLWASEH